MITIVLDGMLGLGIAAQTPKNVFIVGALAGQRVKGTRKQRRRHQHLQMSLLAKRKSRAVDVTMITIVLDGMLALGIAAQTPKNVSIVGALAGQRVKGTRKQRLRHQ